MYCRPNVMPAVVHPTQCCVNHTFSTTVVPHIHPTHTTTVNHQMIQHKHFFPQTQSMVNQVSNQQFSCGPGPMPGGMPGPMPGAMPGGMPGPMPGGMPGPMPGAMPGGMPGPMPGGFPGQWGR